MTQSDWYPGDYNMTTWSIPTACVENDTVVKRVTINEINFGIFIPVSVAGFGCSTS